MTGSSPAGCSASVAGFLFPITFQLTCHLSHVTVSPRPPPNQLKILPRSCLSLIFPSHVFVPPLLPVLGSNLLFLPQLHKVAVGRASDLLKVHGEQLPLRALKAAGAEGNLEAVAEYSRTLTEQKEQLVEVGQRGFQW